MSASCVGRTAVSRSIPLAPTTGPRSSRRWRRRTPCPRRSSTSRRSVDRADGDVDAPESTTSLAYRETVERDHASVLHLARALSARAEPVRLALITSGVHALDSSDPLHPERGAAARRRPRRPARARTRRHAGHRHRRARGPLLRPLPTSSMRSCVSSRPNGRPTSSCCDAASAGSATSNPYPCSPDARDSLDCRVACTSSLVASVASA